MVGVGVVHRHRRRDSCVGDAMSAHTKGPWLVTYLNPLDNRRHTLIDNIDEETADAVVLKFGDTGDQFHRLPEVRKERAAAITKATGVTR